MRLPGFFTLSIAAFVILTTTNIIGAPIVRTDAPLFIESFEGAAPVTKVSSPGVRYEVALDDIETKDGKRSMAISYELPRAGFCGFGTPLEDSVVFGSESRLQVWVYNDAPKPDAWLLVDLSADSNFADGAYGRAVVPLDWSGWRLLNLPKDRFTGTRESSWQSIIAARFFVQAGKDTPTTGTVRIDDLQATGARIGEPITPLGWLWDDPAESAPVKVDRQTQENAFKSLQRAPMDSPNAIAVSMARGLFGVANEASDAGLKWAGDISRSLGAWYLKVGVDPKLDKKLFPFRQTMDFPVVYKSYEHLDWEKINDRAVQSAASIADVPRDRKIVNVYLISRSHEDIADYNRGGPGDYERKLKLALDTMGKSDDFRWTVEQGCLLYAYWVSHPQDRGRVTRYVREGRLEIMGPWQLFYGTQEHGEALIQSIRQTQDWVRKTFGINVDTLCRSDSSAQPDQLPQIAAKLGIQNLFLQFHSTVDDDLTGNPPKGPNALSEFTWQSADGSKVLVHRMMRWYLGIGRDALDTMSQADRFKLIRTWIDSLLPSAQSSNIHIPVSDDFGWPHPIIIETMKAWNRDILPKTGYRLVLGTPSMYLAAVKKQLREENRALKVVHGGDFGSPWWIGGFMESPVAKVVMRRAETKLLEAQSFATVASVLGMTYPRDAFKRGWNLIARMYKHDGIEGSAADYCRAGSIIGMSDWILGRSLDQIAGKADTSGGSNYPLLVFNALGWERTDTVKHHIALPQGYHSVKVVDPVSGAELMSQVLEQSTYPDGSINEADVLFTGSCIPSLGYKLYNLIPLKSDKAQVSSIKISDTSLENRYYRLTINSEQGGSIRVWDKQYGKEVVTGGCRLREILEPWIADGQGIYSLGTRTTQTCIGAAKVQVLERGPNSVRALIESELGAVKIQTEITLYNDIRRIDLRTSLDLSKIPVEDRNFHTYTIEFPFTEEGTWVHATPYGSIHRSIRDKDYDLNDYFLCREASDCANERYGIALLSRDLQTFRVYKNVNTLALCRFDSANRWVSPMNTTCEYALYPHAGDWNAAQVNRRGIEFNYPLIAIQPTKHKGELPVIMSFAGTEGDGAILTMLKRGEDDADALIFRLLETRGKGANARLRFFKPLDRIALTTLMEKPVRTSPVKSQPVNVRLKPRELATVAGWLRK